MKDNIGWLGERTLKEICLPGTHNSGMSKLFGGTSFAKPCNTNNQSRNIRRQLELGIRFFDVRPVISGGVYKAGHYSKALGATWQGGNGHTIESIVNNINAFTKKHHELIIIRLSHTLNTDLGNSNFRPFNVEEWNKVLEILDKTENLYASSEDAYLPITPLDDFIKNGTQAAVVYVIDDEKGCNLGRRIGKGFFYQYGLRLFDQYSNTDKLPVMANDQIDKMKKMSRLRYFLLSWTLTQNAFDVAACPRLGNSIANLAMKANIALNSLLSHVTKIAYPNIISVDYVQSTNVTEIAMTINLKWLSERVLELNNYFN
nr:uncharacterized protein LOC106686227 [Halyomorpha halys]